MTRFFVSIICCVATYCFGHELAFDERGFLLSEKVVSLSPNGQFLAYSVQQKPKEISLFNGWAGDGTPCEVIGSHIFVCRASDGKELELHLPEGDSWRPAWAPDSSKLAFYSNAGGYPELWVFTLATGKSRKVCSLPIKSIDARDIALWSPDSNSLIIPIAAEKQEEECAQEAEVELELHEHFIEEKKEAEPTQIEVADTALIRRLNPHSIARVDLKTGEVSIIAREMPGFCELSSSGKWLVSYTPKLVLPAKTTEWLYDLVLRENRPGAETVTLLAGDIALQDDLKIFAWHPTKDLGLFIKKGKLFLTSCDGKEAKRLADGFEIFNSFISFTPDGKMAVVHAAGGIVFVPLDGSAPIVTTLDGNWRVLELVHTTSNVLWQPKNESLTLFCEENRSGERAIVRILQGKAGSEILWRGRAKMAEFVGAQNGELFCYYEDFTTPQNIYRFSSDFSTRTKVTEIDSRKNSLPEISYKLFDTVVSSYNGKLEKVETAVLLPKGFDEKKPLPAICMIYPGKNISRNINAFCGGAPTTIPNFLFLNQGYAIIMADVPLQPEGQPGNPVQQMLDVLVPQVQKVVTLGYVDPKRLAIIGHSYGAYGVASIISKTNLFRASAAIGGVYDLVGGYGYLEIEDQFSQRWTEQSQGRMGTHPWANLFRYVNNSPYFLAETITTPLFLVHGEADRTSRMEESEKMFVALKRLNREVHLAIYLGEDHVMEYWKRANACDAANRLIQFFDTHCK